MLWQLSFDQHTSPTEIINSFDEAKIDFFKEDARIQNSLKILFENNEELIEMYYPWIKAKYKQLIRSFENESIQNLIVVSTYLELREAHPIEAFFRGCISNDCSTKYSAFYPLLKSERNFYIYDSQNNIKGSVSTTMTQINGKNNLYVHTISGKYISDIDTFLILEMFNKSKHILGIESISLPREGIIPNLINFSGPRNAFLKAIKLTPETPQSYSNEDLLLRSKINSFHKNLHQSLGLDLNLDYDKAANHTWAHLYSLPVSIDLKTNIESSSKQRKPDISKAIDVLQAFQFAFKQEQIKREDTSERLLMAFGYTNLEASELILKIYNIPLNNSKFGINSADYRGYINDFFSKLNIATPSFYENVKIFGRGALRSEDAFEPMHINDSIYFIISLLDEEPLYTREGTVWQLTWFGEVVQSNLNILLTHPAFINYFNESLKKINIEKDFYKKSTAEKLIKLGVHISLASESFYEHISHLINSIYFNKSDKIDQLMIVEHIISLAIENNKIKDMNELSELFQNYPDFNELEKVILRIYGPNTYNIIYSMAYTLLSLKENKEEFLTLLESLTTFKPNENNNPDKINQLLSLNIVVALKKKIKDLDISAEELNFLDKDVLKGLNAINKILAQTQIDSLTTEFRLYLMGGASQEQMSIATDFTLKYFDSLNPTASQWNNYLIHAHLKGDEILDLGIKSVKSADDFLKLHATTPLMHKTSKSIRESIADNIDLFLSLNPTLEQLEKIKSIVPNFFYTVKKISLRIKELEESQNESTTLFICPNSIN